MIREGERVGVGGTRTERIDYEDTFQIIGRGSFWQEQRDLE